MLHAAAEAFGEYTGMCAELIEARRGSAETDDIISILTNAEDSGLTSDELLMFLTLLVVAGNETTRNAHRGPRRACAPDQKDRLLAEPELIDTAVDEIVRFVSPVMSFCRTVTETHEYQGTRLEQGRRS